MGLGRMCSKLVRSTGGNRRYVADQMGHASIDILDRTHARVVKETQKGRRLDREEVFAKVLAAYRSAPVPDEKAKPAKAELVRA